MAYIGFNKFSKFNVSTKIGGSGGYNEQYEIEKTKYIIVSDLVSEMRITMNNKAIYEFNSIMERFLLSYYNEYGNILDQPIRLNSKPFKQLKIELENKKDLFGNWNKIKNHIIKIWNKGAKALKASKYTKSNQFDKIKYGNNYIIFDNIFMNINSITLSNLKRFDPMDIKLMILRYKTFVSGGQQWSIPRPVYINLYNIGARYEAFASPLNSKMMGLKDAKFCSLFPDIDKPFGSIGNFFDIDLYSNKDERIWVMNPPFVEDLLNKSMEKVIESLDHCVKNNLKLTVYGVMPAWTDMRSYIQMKTSSYLKYDERLHKGKYYYEGDKKITALFDSHAYCLSTELRDFLGKEMFKDMQY